MSVRLASESCLGVPRCLDFARRTHIGAEFGLDLMLYSCMTTNSLAITLRMHHLAGLVMISRAGNDKCHVMVCLSAESFPGYPGFSSHSR